MFCGLVVVYFGSFLMCVLVFVVSTSYLVFVLFCCSLVFVVMAWFPILLLGLFYCG